MAAADSLTVSVSYAGYLDFSNILVRATNWVGNAVMSLPALRAIRARFSTARISVLAKPWVADLYGRESFIDEIILYSGQSPWRTGHELRARRATAGNCC
jgi:ADP-heptose:LPS heptosyltransferase